MIVNEAERHQLFEREFVLLVGSEQDRAGMGELQALLDDRGGDAERGGDGLLAFPLVA